MLAAAVSVGALVASVCIMWTISTNLSSSVHEKVGRVGEEIRQLRSLDRHETNHRV